MVVCKPQDSLYKFHLNLSTELYHKLELENKKGWWDRKKPEPVWNVDPYVFNLGDNIYATKNAFPLLETSGILETIKTDIQNFKNNFCPCVQSSLNYTKIIITVDEDKPVLNSRIGSLAGWATGLTVVIYLSKYYPSVIQHELIHTTQFCSPCRDSEKNKNFDSKVKVLYDYYTSVVYPDIARFNKLFIKEVSSPFSPVFLTDFEAKLEYAATNTIEFMASLTTFFCFFTSEIFLDNNAEFRTKYIARFNLEYRMLAAKICELYNINMESLFSDHANCNENFENGIETNLYIRCETHKPGYSPGIGMPAIPWWPTPSEECLTFSVAMEIDPDAGCCDSDEKESKIKINLGKINLHDPCKCWYIYNLDIYSIIEDIIKMMSNCKYISPDTEIIKDNNLINLSNDIDRQIFDALNNYFSGGLYRPEDIPKTNCNVY